jgi:sialic acid synthase SpsE
MIKIYNRKIGDNFRPFIIAEACINHDGIFNKAIKMIKEAKKSNACAIKFQMHDLDDEMLKKTPKSKNFKESLYETLKKTNFTTEQHIKLKKFCEKIGIIYLCTPFSKKSVDELVNKVKVKLLKVGSGELTNLPLQEYIAKKKLPTIVSTGMSELNEIKETVNIYKKFNKNIILTHCTSIYPCPYELSNIGAIPIMKKKFNLSIGLSDHTSTIYTSLGAIALGATVIEKHFTLNKKSKGPDHASSIEPSELKLLTDGAIAIYKASGKSKKIHKKEIQIIKWARESVVSIKEIKKGEIFSKKNISVKRPAPNSKEIPAKFLNKVLGKKAKKEILNNQKIKWSQIN